ncbi:MAG: OadG family protein [Clostridia bacterium]|nr:OadG family protein [Clostridia bacterium]
MDVLTVVVLGVGVVFAGLICIVILCKITGALCTAMDKGENKETVTAAPVAAAPAVIENRQEIIAAVSAVIAEELGTDISAIRIHSFKKL